MPAVRSPDLVGRDADLATLAAELQVGGEGDPGSSAATAVLLAGDAGVGKTRVLTELGSRATADGWLVVVGHCLDLADSALPYLPFTEILGRLTTDHPDRVSAGLRRHPVLDRLRPGRRLHSAAVAEATSLERADLMEAVHALLDDAASGGRPLLVVVEDAHWADASTRDMLSFLFARPFASPVRFLVTYRAEDLHRRHPLRPRIGAWARLPGVERVPLGPLAPRDVRRLVRLIHPGPLAKGEVSHIVRRAEGNPFFVEELVGAAAAASGLPDDLADLLLLRLDRLEEDARAVVRTAAAAGAWVTHAQLAAAADLPPVSLEPALRAAVDHNVLEPARGDAYAFRHALLADAVYGDLLPGERVRIHASYVAALRDRGVPGTAAELARHARLAGDRRTALLASVEAGDEARSVGGPDEAARHYEQALALLGVLGGGHGEGLDAVLLSTRAADSLIAAGRGARAVAVLRDHLSELGPDAPELDRGRLEAALAHAMFVIDTPQDPRPHARTAVRLLREAPMVPRVKALATHARIAADYGETEVAREAALEALTLAKAEDLPRLASDLLTTLAGLDKAGPVERLTASIESAVTHARDAGAVNAELRALHLLGRVHQDRAEFAAARAAFGRVLARAHEAGIPWAPYALESRLMDAAMAFATGAWDDVIERTDLGTDPPPEELLGDLLRAVGSSVRAARGALGPATACHELRPRWPEDAMLALWAASTELELAEHTGDAAAALGTYRAVVATLSAAWREQFQARIRFSAQALGVLGTAARTASAEERRRLAPEALRLAAEGRRVVTFHREAGIRFGPEGVAWASRLEAEALRWQWLSQVDPPPPDALLTAWETTAERFAGYGHVYELARVRARWAEILRAAGHPARAREVSGEAMTSARELGAEPLRRELLAAGQVPRQRPTASASALTDRERDVLRLVAEGRSNGEIGRQLYISTKTVSVHVSNILGKLGASGRTEAAAIARRDGLLGPE